MPRFDLQNLSDDSQDRELNSMHNLNPVEEGSFDVNLDFSQSFLRSPSLNFSNNIVPSFKSELPPSFYIYEIFPEGVVEYKTK